MAQRSRVPSVWRSRLMPMLKVPIGASGQTFVFSRRVLKLFEDCRQTAPGVPEAGGQLFAKLAGNQIRIQQATGPRPSDERGRAHFVPDRLAEQGEIARMHKDGLHYIGDWHSHPDEYPSPSTTDIRSIRECVLRSRHELNGFVMVVVGTGPVPQSLHISIHDGSIHSVLKSSEAERRETKVPLRKRVLTKLLRKLD